MSAQPSDASQMRIMRQGDLDAVAAIEQRAYPFPWTAGIFRDCLRVGHECWVLDCRAGIIGYGVLSCAAAEAHVLNLCVAPGCDRAVPRRAVQRNRPTPELRARGQGPRGRAGHGARAAAAGVMRSGWVATQTGSASRAAT